MSVKVMSAVWERDDLDASERLVMLSLADHADDEGVCYPSIARLCKRTSIKERAVQSAIKRLCERGFLTIQRGAGRNGTNLFIVNATPALNAPPQQMHPRIKCATPPQQMRPTPAANAPKPSRTINEPSKSNTGEAVAVLAEVVGQDLAQAFVAHRKAGKSPLTTHAAQLIAKKLSAFPDPAAAIETSIINGWKGVFAERSTAAVAPRIRAQLPKEATQ